MDIFKKIADRKITSAIKEGLLDDLPGNGKPLVFEDETFIPEELRLAYRILKNEGFVPPEVELRKEIISLRSLINTLDDNKERLRKIREFNFKVTKLNLMRKMPLNLEVLPEYEDKAFSRLCRI